MTFVQILLKNQAKNSPKSHKLPHASSLPHPASSLTAGLISRSAMASPPAIHYPSTAAEARVGIGPRVLLTPPNDGLALSGFCVLSLFLSRLPFLLLAIVPSPGDFIGSHSIPVETKTYFLPPSPLSTGRSFRTQFQLYQTSRHLALLLASASCLLGT